MLKSMLKSIRFIRKGLIVFMILLLTFAFSAMVQAGTITNDQDWKDTNNNLIRCESGCVVKGEDGVYYWYGRDANSNSKVVCYSSTNLQNWTFERQVMQNSQALNNWNGGGQACRPDVIYNASTGKYVLTIGWAAGTRPQIAFFTSNTPTGDFWWVRTVRYPDGTHSMGDKGCFKDSNGDAYILCTVDVTETNSHHGIFKMTSNYCNIDQDPVYMGTQGAKKEAYSMIKHTDGYYYYFASSTRGWYSTPSWYKRATTIAGMPGDWTRMPTNPPSESYANQTYGTGNSYNTQHDWVMPVQGTSGGLMYVYGGDRWSQNEPQVGGEGRYAWFPLTISGGVPTINGMQKWDINLTNATYSRLNTINNTGFEWDSNVNSSDVHVDQDDITAWAKSGANTGASKAVDPNPGVGDSYVGGNNIDGYSSDYVLQHKLSSAYQVYTSQTISPATGSRSFSAYVKSSKNQNSCYMEIKNYDSSGGGSTKLQINNQAGVNNSTWTKVTLSNVNIESSSCVIGFYSDSPANGWLMVDDVSCSAGTGSTPTPTTTPTPTPTPTPAPTSTPTPGPTGPLTGNLNLWLKADAGLTLNGSNVSAWADQSGIGNNLSQATASKQPLKINSAINGLPAVSFDGSDDFLARDITDYTGDSTVHMVVKLNSTGQTLYKGIFATATSNVAGSYQIDLDGGAPGNIRLWNGTTAYNITAETTNYQVLTIKRASDYLSVIVNGQWIYTYNASNPPDPGTTDCITYNDYRLGTNRAGGGFANCEIAEVLVYNAAQSQADYGQVAGYLGDKYNLF